MTTLPPALPFRKQTFAVINVIPKHVIIMILLGVLAAGLFLFQLGSARLDSWDEAIYAQAAKEVLSSGDWITLHWNQKEFFQKPPLAIWLTALLFKFFGISEFTARAVSAVSGIGVVLLTFLLARRFFGEWPAVISAIAILVSAPLFQFARFGTMDVLLTFFMLLAVYSYVKTKEESRWWLLVGISCGLAVMTKGAAAVPLLVALLIAAVLDRKRLGRDLLAGIVLFIVIGGTWHFAMIYLHGAGFLNDYFGRHVFDRAISSVDEKPDSLFYYLPVVGVFFPLLPFGLLRLWKERDVPAVVPILGLMIILLYSFVSTKHAWYILPALPFVSVLIAPARGSSFRLWIYLLMIILSIGLMFFDPNHTRTLKAAHEVVAEMSIRASQDGGRLAVFPEIDFGPEVLFYSNRTLCVDSDTQHTMAPLARCSEPPTHIILPSWDMNRLKTRYKLTPLATSGALVYCKID